MSFIRALAQHSMLPACLLWGVLASTTVGFAGHLTGMLDWVTAGIGIALGAGPLACVFIDALMASTAPAQASLNLDSWGSIDNLFED